MTTSSCSHTSYAATGTKEPGIKPKQNEIIQEVLHLHIHIYMFSFQPGYLADQGICTALHQPLAEGSLPKWSEVEKKGTHLLETPRTAGVHSQTLLACAGPSGGADVWTCNQNASYSSKSSFSIDYVSPYMEIFLLFFFFLLSWELIYSLVYFQNNNFRMWHQKFGWFSVKRWR